MARGVAIVLASVAALLLGCGGATRGSLLGIRSDAAALEQTSLEYALRGDLARALDIEEQALLAYRSVDDTDAIAGALNRVGNLRQRTGDAEGARLAYLEAQSLARLTGDRAEEAAARSNLGTLYEEAGDLGAADAEYRAARELAEAADAQATLATILNNQALLARRQGDPGRAIELLDAALEIDRDRGNESGAANRLRNLGAVYAASGRRAEALAALSDALEIDRRRENVPEIALDLVTLSEVRARDPDELGRAISERRRAADIHRLLGRTGAVARDAAVLAAWCDQLRDRDPGAVGLVDCVPRGIAGTEAVAPVPAAGL